MQGLVGVVVAPARGMERGGAAGFLRGCGWGLLGVVTKPAAAVAHRCLGPGGLLAFATIGSMKKRKLRRVRPPRLVDAARGLRVFERAAAEGEELLARAGQVAAYRADGYVFHARLQPRLQPHLQHRPHRRAAAGVQGLLRGDGGGAPHAAGALGALGALQRHALLTSRRILVLRDGRVDLEVDAGDIVDVELGGPDGRRLTLLFHPPRPAALLADFGLALRSVELTFAGAAAARKMCACLETVVGHEANALRLSESHQSRTTRR